MKLSLNQKALLLLGLGVLAPIDAIWQDTGGGLETLGNRLSNAGSTSNVVDSNPDTGGGPDFFCQPFDDIEFPFACIYTGDIDGSFPYDTPDSWFQTLSTVNLSIGFEPTEDNSICSVVLLDPTTGESKFCKSCSILPTDSTVDGLWEIQYDCGNLLLDEPCAGRSSSGECISSVGQPPNAVDPATGGGTGFSCVDVDLGWIPGGEQLCVFSQDPSFPFDNLDSFMYTICARGFDIGGADEPSETLCPFGCTVAMGQVENMDFARECNSCSFIPSTPETDGFWEIAYDCSNVLDGDCVGRDSLGECVDDATQTGAGF